MPQKDAREILDVANSLVSGPFWGDIKKMQGLESIWRRRVGSYRIFYDVKAAEKTILVLRVERRTSQTY